MTTRAAGDAAWPVPLASANRDTARPIERTVRTKRPGMRALVDLDLERYASARTRSERADRVGEPRRPRRARSRVVPAQRTAGIDRSRVEPAGVRRPRVGVRRRTRSARRRAVFGDDEGRGVQGDV